MELKIGFEVMFEVLTIISLALMICYALYVVYIEDGKMYTTKALNERILSTALLDVCYIILLILSIFLKKEAGSICGNASTVIALLILGVVDTAKLQKKRGTIEHNVIFTSYDEEKAKENENEEEEDVK